MLERSFDRAMGLCTDGQSLWLATAFQLWRLENALADGEDDGGFDRIFVPRVGYTTGDVDAHDVAVDAHGAPIFVSTRFSCLATVSERYSFTPLWQPPFVSKLAAEDRCHLNGLAVHNGQPRFVTAFSRTDVFHGWREHRGDGGCVIDVASGEIVAHGLAMPHSPRWHDEALWLLNSGAGEFGRVNLATGRFEPIAFCPGYARGLAFHNGFALVGASRPRDPLFQGLPLERSLAERGAAPRTGLLVIDLASGDVVHWLTLEGAVTEIYDVAVLPGVVRPSALGFKTDDILLNVWVDHDGAVRRWRGTAAP